MREKDPTFRAVAKRKDGYKEGFDRGFSPEKILGGTNKYGFQQFLIKWKGIDDADMVRATEAKERCPDLVREFYEKRLKFEEENSKESVENGVENGDSKNQPGNRDVGSESGNGEMESEPENEEIESQPGNGDVGSESGSGEMESEPENGYIGS